jgi:hypothetical protein
MIKRFCQSMRESGHAGAIAFGLAMATALFHFAPPKSPALLAGMPLYLLAACAALVALFNHSGTQIAMGALAIVELVLFTMKSENGIFMVFLSVLTGSVLWLPAIYAIIALVAFRVLHREPAA